MTKTPKFRTARISEDQTDSAGRLTADSWGVAKAMDGTIAVPTQGSIAFTAIQSDNSGGGANGDFFQFVLLEAVTTGTTIYFTDNGFRTDTSTFRTNETMVRWVAQGNLPAGTLISLTGPAGGTIPSTAEWTGINPSTGATLATASLTLAAGGENITALINPVFGGAEALTGTAIAAITQNPIFAATFTNASGNASTALPPGLTDGVNAVSIATFDNSRYNGTTTGTAADLLAAINNDANWTGGNTPLTPHSVASFTVTPVASAGMLAIDDVTLAEGDAGTTAFTFTVTRSGGSSGAVGATWTLTAPGGAGNADAGDFDGGQLFTGTVSFADGDTSETITILVLGDNLVEDDEAFTVTLSLPTGGVTIADATGAGSITNDDAAGAFSIDDVTITEGNGGTTPMTFTVTRAGGDDGAVTVGYSVVAPGGGGVADSADFAGGTVFSGTVDFAQGETSRTIILDVVGDPDFEPDETFEVQLDSVTSGTIADGTGIGTIQNDDAAPAGTLSIDDVSLSEGDNGSTTTFTFTVTRSAGSAGAITADYAISAPGGAGNADTDDFVAGAIFSGQVAFADGETSQTISIDVEGDVDFEADEAFTITLSNATGGAGIGIGTGTGTGTIVNDDLQPPAGQVAIADASIVEGDSGTQILVLNLTRIGGTGAFDVDYATSNGGTPGNASASAGSDYVAASGTASFASGQNLATIQITINGDTLPELDEEFTVTLSDATNGATISDPTAIVTIESDDPQPASTRIFEEDFAGFTAGGFAPNPTATQIDSDIWRVVGLSDIANPAYGFTATTGDFARGTIASNDPTTAGVYSPLSNPALIVQPTGAELDIGGFIEARLENNSGSTATGFDIAFDWSYRNSGGRASSLQLSYSTDGINFITVPAGAFTTPADAAALTGVFALQPTAVSLTGLAVAAGEFIYLRWIHASSAGSGNRDEIGIDNLIVDATGGATGPLVSVSDVSVNEAAGTMTFTVTRANAAAGAFTVDYETANGTATAGSDYVATSGTLSFGENQVSATVTVTVNDDGTPELDETLLLNLSDPSGATVADGQGVGTIVNDDGPPILVSINDVSIVEGDGGTSLLIFTVTRTGGTGAFDVDFETADGTAVAPGDYLADSGTLSFGVGQNSQTVSITINGDLEVEPNEAFQVLLSDATNDAIIVDGAGTGTIVNDEPSFIHDIQGAGYFSPILLGDGITSFNTASTTAVVVRAIVTAVDNVGNRQGYYLQEEITDADANTFTSEAIFVMTRNDAGVGTVVAGVSLGDLVDVSANVMEYQAFSSMPRTVLVNPTGLSIISTGNALPAATVLIGMPNDVLTDVTPDYINSTNFGGALGYFESLEGMLVIVPNMVVADGFVSTSGGDPFLQAYSLDSANPDQINDRGGYTIAGDPPIGPPDTAETGDDTEHGGRHLHDGDVNPDIIELDFTDFATSAPAGLLTGATMGDQLGDVTGIIDFDFTDRKLFVTAMEPGGFVDGGSPVQETTALGSDGRSLTVATFNVENLDPGDGAARFTALANAIATNLNAPDIICIEEMQDNNGAAGGGTDASVTWQMLVDALNLATGSNYQWVDQDPNGSEGGEPGGNIRVGFLYNTDRVQLGDLDASATIAERRQYTDRIGDGVRDAGDLIAFSDDMLGAEINATDWGGTRRSLLGEFNFNGNTVYVTANHWPAKGGSGEFWQFNQNLEAGQPLNSGWTQRNAVAQDVYSMLNLVEGGAPDAGIVAGGDFNDFYFYRPLTTVTGYTMADGSARAGGARFDNLTLTLAEAERYTYTFDGRSQAIDHIIVNGLLSAVASYDIVHLNTGYNENGTSPALSDHDPGLSSFDYREFDEILTGTAGNDVIDGFGGDDTIVTGLGNDELDGGAGADHLEGGDGDDIYHVDDAGDVVVEADGEGQDTIRTTINYRIGATTYVEILAAAVPGGTDPLALTGNAFANQIIGNAGANVLHGAGGADTLTGLGGNDIYLTDVAATQIVEAVGEGTDALYTSVSYVLAGAAQVETLSTNHHAATAAINLTGNNFGQTLVGNAGANVLHGGGGADVLIGLGGNDIYLTDSATTAAYESAGGGTDTLLTSISYTLASGSEVEVLSTNSHAATATIDLTGNQLGQAIYGNAGANTLDGKLGTDTLIGLGGIDTFAFTSALGGSNVDYIRDMIPGTDKIALDNAAFTGLLDGPLPMGAFVNGTVALEADDRILYNSANGFLYFDADGNGPGAARLFAVLQNQAAITANDFLVI